MRTSPLALLLLTATPALALAQEEAAARPSLLDPRTGVMFWTLILFLVLLFVLSKFAFRPLLSAVEARERSLEEAIAAAARDREEAARLLAEQQRQLEASRTEGQRLLAEGRQAGERMRAELLEQARREQQEMLERARHEIGLERDRAIADLRREAVDLAVAGASKVIERNLDDQTNRRLVESFLASLEPARSERP